MDIFSFDLTAILSFMLTLLRVSVVLFMLPVFSSQNIPIQVKAAMSLVLTFGLWPHLAFRHLLMPPHLFSIGLMVLGEVILGLVLGMAVNFFFMGIQAGGELLGFQMGFSMMTFADPMTGNQTGTTAFFLWIIAILTFLAFDGHLYLLKAFAGTFELIPPGGLLLGDRLLTHVLNLSARLFLLALRIAAPVMVALFLVELALGLVARTSPQIHVMEIGFSVKIIAGFMLIAFLLLLMQLEVEHFILNLDDLFSGFMHIMTPIRQGVSGIE